MGNMNGHCESTGTDSITISILAISVITLIVVLAGTLATFYLARVLRHNATYECTCSKRTYNSPQQSGSDGSPSKHLPGMTDSINPERENQKRASSTSDSIKGSCKEGGSKKQTKNSPRKSSKDKANTKENGPSHPQRAHRSASLPYTKNWLGVRPMRHSDAAGDSPSQKRAKKEKVLKNNPVESALLQNMREINYELRSKSDFKQPGDIVPEEESDHAQDGVLDRRTAPDVVSVASSFVDDSSSIRTSGPKDAPHYYTLEPESAENESISDRSGDDNNISMPETLYDNTIHFANRSMSDAHQKQKTKKASFKFVSSARRGDADIAGNGRSNTWNARELEKQNRNIRQQRQHADGYEDVAADTGNDAIAAAEADGSYSLLSRSLDIGIEGKGRNKGTRIELPGYQKLTVGPDFKVDSEV